jgi:pyridoxal-phosphate dependent enzyme
MIFSSIRAPTFVEICDEWLGDSRRNCRVFTSLEGHNPGGSIKDWMVAGELAALVRAGALAKGDCIAEASAGSTARSLAVFSKQVGLRCVLFVPNRMSCHELTELIQLGADVRPVEIEGAYERFDAFCAATGARSFNQLKDVTKRRHYHSFGRFVSHMLGPIDVVVGAVGTGHSLVGVSEGIESNPVIVSAEPLRGGIPGIRNVVGTRYGDDDPCNETWFDRRIEVGSADYFPGSDVETTSGPIHVSDSFRVVLGAARVLVAEAARLRLFLVGASNTRRS